MCRSSTRDLLLHHPLLLAVPSANLSYKLEELQMVLEVPCETAVALLISDPTAVLTSPSSALKLDQQ